MAGPPSLRRPAGRLEGDAPLHRSGLQDLGAVYQKAEQQGKTLSWTELFRMSWFTLFRPMRMAAVTLLFVCFTTVLVMKVVPATRRSSPARMDLVPCDLGSSYDDRKVVAVAVAPGTIPSRSWTASTAAKPRSSPSKKKIRSQDRAFMLRPLILFHKVPRNKILRREE